MQAMLAAAGAALVFVALWPSFGYLNPWALALVTLGAVAGLAALLVGRRADGGAAESLAPVSTRAVLLVGLALSLGAQVLEIPGTRVAPLRHPYFTSLAWVAVAVALTYLLRRPPAWVERFRFPVLVGCFLLMGATLLLTGPSPRVDVWMFQQEGGRQLFLGVNPYELVFPNVYSHDRFYGPGVLENGKVLVYPYPPLVPLLEGPVVLLLGDVRWLLLGAMALAAWIIARLGGSSEAELAGLLVLFQPRGLHVAVMAWTEPLVLLAWVMALLAMVRWRHAAPRGWVGAGLTVALLLGTKQYAPLLALPLLLVAPRTGRFRAVALALAAVAALTLPFVIWNPAEFWRDVVACQFRQPFRLDALSWLSVVAHASGIQLPAAVGFTLAGAAMLAGLRPGPTLRQAAVSAAVAFLFLVLFNKQAFCNYYWLAGALLATAAALADQTTDQEPLPAGETR